MSPKANMWGTLARLDVDVGEAAVFLLLVQPTAIRTLVKSNLRWT